MKYIYIFFFRIKIYQSSGLDKKIVDPDGGIHRERKRHEAKTSSNTVCPGDVASRIEWPKDGWTCSLNHMPNFQHCFIYEHLAADMKKGSSEMRQGAFKSKRDGYALFKASHVQKVKFNSTSHKDLCFFESRVKASMTRHKSYKTMVCLSKSTSQVLSGSCNCKAGMGGRCKHVGALLYTVLDYVESDLSEIPEDASCTDKPQQWNKPHSTVVSGGAIPIEELLFTKHSYYGDKTHQKSEKRAQRSLDRQAYNASPSFATKVNELQIKTLCENLKAIKTPTKPMIIDLLEGNNYKPCTNAMVAAREARTKVHQDHDYYCLPVKRKLCFEVEMSKKQCTEEQTNVPGNVSFEPLNTNHCTTASITSHCETVQTQSIDMSTQDQLDCICDSQSDIQTEIDISKQLLLPKSDVKPPFSDEADLTGSSFQAACVNFVESLTISDKEIKKIESATRGQSQNEEWFKFRSGRVTASYFGEIKNRRPTTPPDRLVKDIFQYGKRRATPPQCLEGQRLEPIIRDKYILKQTQMGHIGLTVKEKGLIIDNSNPLLAASIDGEVHDPIARHGSVGNLEMKYKQFPKKMEEFIGNAETPKLLCILADKKKGFCLENQNGTLKLKHDHRHFAQIQGGMGVTGRAWSDLVVYTYYKGYEDVHIERIYFDPIYWRLLKAKLLDFCLFAIVPEILSQRVKRGKQLYPSLFVYK